MFIGKYNKSVILTYIGIAFAIAGVYVAFVFQSARYALLCLVVAGICDLFDGVVARKIKRTEKEKEFGVQIDSLADMINFVFLPISICFALGMNSYYHLALYIFYALAALIRLAYFNITVESFTTHFIGLPTTYVALILPIVWILSLFISKEMFNIIFSITMLVIGLLFILNVRIVKPKGIFYIIFPLLAIIQLFVLIFVGV